MTNQPSNIRDEYISYVRLEKNYSFYTVSEYEKDVNSFLVFLEVEGISDLDDVTYPNGQTLCDRIVRQGVIESIDFKEHFISPFFLQICQCPV